jgi:DNA processing protein
VADAGLLISQFLPDAPPQKHNFLMRNATMSGYGIATVVIEAGEHSGARAQARMAVEHGRPVILTDAVLTRNDWAKALEGRPGVHIASSTAHVVRVVEDLIDAPKRVEDVLESLVAL